jgi:hypothetical protein
MSVRQLRPVLSSANFIALLFGIIAVIALYVSATDADKRIAAANERASAADERAASLEKQAAELRLALEREQATHLPRTIRPEQQAKLIERLTPTRKGPVIMNVATLDSTDAKSFAAQISDVLTNSGFTISPPEADTLSFSLPGAWLVVHDINKAPLHAKAIQDAFKDEAGILLIGFSKPELLKDLGTVMICVSSHPP